MRERSRSRPSRWLPWMTLWWATALTVPAGAQELLRLAEPRAASFVWDAGRRAVYASASFSDVVDQKTQDKLTRGLPTEILFTALLFAGNSTIPISTTYQSCRITWHVWEEMYRIEVTRTNQRKSQRHWTPTLSGVLRRCAQVQRLLVAEAGAIPIGQAIHLQATVRINPVNAELLAKLKRWVNRPTQSTTAAPGSALFSTFTGLFMQRIGDAERTITFSTHRSIPE